jgi:uncharacterized membrane protein
MAWLQRCRLRAFFKSSLWPLPLAGLIAALLVAPLVCGLDRRTGWTSDIAADGAGAVVDNLSSALLTFLVFVSSMLLLAVQLASAQLTPRIIARIFRGPVTRLTLAVFIFFCALVTFCSAGLTAVVAPSPAGRGGAEPKKRSVPPSGRLFRPTFARSRCTPRSAVS